MGTIAKVTAGGATHLIASTAYATCPTGASTAAKVATIQDSQAFTLIDGITVHVYFTYSNTVANPTLNVNSTGAKAIYKFGSTAAGTTEVDSWPAGSVVSFTYNKNGASGGCWTINNFQKQTAQVNADWTATTGTSSILNKPTIPAAQVNSNWTATTGVASILNKPSIPSTYSDVGAASAAHVHGNITSDGDITSNTTIANGDRLVINDESASKIINSSITFGTSSTSFLANDGTWQTPTGSGALVVDYGDTNVTWSQFENAITNGQDIIAREYDEQGNMYQYYFMSWYNPSSGNADGSVAFTSFYSNQKHVIYWAEDEGWGSKQTTTFLTSHYITTWYGTCSTTASTAQKVVTCTSYAARAGNIIGILFTTANTAATPTLNINSTGAKSIYIGTSMPDSTTNVLKWSANTMVYFMYDGTYYRYIYSMAAASVTQPRGANTWYGTSSTAATTQAKTSTIDNFVLTKGALVTINFSTANSYSGVITLNINSTGAKNIYYKNAATSSTNRPLWKANSCVTFVYSGSYYYIVNITPSPNDEEYDSWQVNVSPQDQDLRAVLGLDPTGQDATTLDSAIESIWTAFRTVQNTIQVTGTEASISAPTSGTMYFASMSSVVYESPWATHVHSDSTGGVRVTKAGYYKVTGSLYVNAASAMAGPSNYRHGVYIFVGTDSNTSSSTEAISHVQLSAGNYAINVGPGLVYANVNDKIYLVYRPLGMTATFSPQNRASYLLVEEMP